MLFVEGLLAGYGGKARAQLPRLQLTKGQSALLVGASGSGKTTLLLAMAGLSEVLAGSVKLGSVELTTLPGRALDRLRGRSIGLIFQDLHLVAGLSTLDNLLLAPYAAGIAQDRSKAMGLLAELGLSDWANRPAETLSRGQAQRTAIARAMLIGPELILADEPTASLDDASCERVWRLLSRAAAETGAPLVVATHDQRLKGLADLTVQAEAVA